MKSGAFCRERKVEKGPIIPIWVAPLRLFAQRRFAQQGEGDQLLGRRSGRKVCCKVKDSHAMKRISYLSRISKAAKEAESQGAYVPGCPGSGREDVAVISIFLRGRACPEKE